MTYVFLEVLVFIVLAALLGLGAGWWLWARERPTLGTPAATDGNAADAHPGQDVPDQDLEALRERIAALEEERDEALARLTRCSEDRDALAGLARQLSDVAPGRHTMAEMAAMPLASAEQMAEARPAFALDGPAGEPDDLKRISGIGPRIEQQLNDIGVYHFRQVAAFTQEDVAWINHHLPFQGRLEREDWIGQARILAEGGETEFSRRQKGAPSS